MGKDGQGEGGLKGGERIGDEPLPVNSQSQILRHDLVVLNRLHASLLERLAKLLEGGVVVQLGSEGKSSRPGKDGRDRVGRRLVAYTSKFPNPMRTNVSFIHRAKGKGTRKEGRGGGGRTLLVLSVVPRNRSMSSLSLHRLSIRRHQLRRHHTQRPVTLCDNVRLVHQPSDFRRVSTFFSDEGNNGRRSE